jgi:hypothetical protein
MDIIKNQQEIIIRYQELVNRLQKVIEMRDDDVKYYKTLYHNEKLAKMNAQNTLDEVNKELFNIKMELIKGNADDIVNAIRQSNQ